MKSGQYGAGSGMEQPARPPEANQFSRQAALFGLLFIATAATVANAASPAAAEAPLAIKGYDPVAYFTDGKPTSGRPEFEYEWDEHIWRFATADHRDLFKADPVRYAPQFGNYCAMALLNGPGGRRRSRELADQRREALRVRQAGTRPGPALFKQQLGENIAKANQNWSILPH